MFCTRFVHDIDIFLIKAYYAWSFKLKDDFWEL